MKTNLLSRTGKAIAALLMAAGLAFAPFAAFGGILSVSAEMQAEEPQSSKYVIDMTTTETRTEDGVTYIGAGAYYSAHVVAGDDFYDESGTTVTEASQAVKKVNDEDVTFHTPATRVTSEDTYFTYRFIIPADTTMLNISIFQTAAGQVIYKNAYSEESTTQTYSAYVNQVRDTDIMANINVNGVIKNATNPDGNYEFEVKFTGGVVMANRFELASNGTICPIDDANYRYGALYESAQDSFLSTYLVKSADLSQAQYDAGLFNATGEQGAASVSDSGQPYMMFSTVNQKINESSLGGDDVYGNGVGWFRFADGGHAATITVENGTDRGVNVGENTFTSNTTDSNVLIYRFRLADLLSVENPEDYVLSKITFRSKTWSGYRLSLYIGEEDIPTVKDDAGNDLYLDMTYEEARQMDTDLWADIACAVYTGTSLQGDYIDLDISSYIIGDASDLSDDYKCDYIYIKVTDSTDTDGQGGSVEGMYLTGFYTYTGDFSISASKGEAETGTAFALNSPVKVDTGYSTNLQTVLSSAVYTIKNESGETVATVSDGHTYTFDTAGTYTVEVAYTDKNGNEAETSYTLEVAQGTGTPGDNTGDDGNSDSSGGCGGFIGLAGTLTGAVALTAAAAVFLIRKNS